MTRVLPVPAPAKMSTGPLTVSAAWRCCGLSAFKFNMRAEFSWPQSEGKHAAEDVCRIGKIKAAGT
jgi:hypothetical protein